MFGHQNSNVFLKALLSLGKKIGIKKKFTIKYYLTPAYAQISHKLKMK